MQSVHKLLKFVLVLSLNQPALAAPPARGPLPKPSQSVMDQALLDAYVRRFNSEVKLPLDVETGFWKFKPKDRAALKPFFKEVNEIPHITRDKDALVLHFKKQDIHLRWPDLKSREMWIEGVSWTFDPSAPMKWQIESLRRKLKAEANTSKSAFYWPDLILPQAHALVPAVAVVAAEGGVAWCAAKPACAIFVIGLVQGVVGGMGGDIKDGITNLWCWALSPAKPWNSVGWCSGWKDALDAKAKNAKLGMSNG